LLEDQSEPFWVLGGPKSPYPNGQKNEVHQQRCRRLRSRPALRPVKKHARRPTFTLSAFCQKKGSQIPRKAHDWRAGGKVRVWGKWAKDAVDLEKKYPCLLEEKGGDRGHTADRRLGLFTRPHQGAPNHGITRSAPKKPPSKKGIQRKRFPVRG